VIDGIFNQQRTFFGWTGEPCGESAVPEEHAETAHNPFAATIFSMTLAL
jgi:hypothetical protein